MNFDNQPNWHEELNAAMKAHRAGKLDESEEILSRLASEFEALHEQGFLAETDKDIYISVDEPFEIGLYNALYEPEKNVKSTGDVPVGVIYMEYGSLLIDRGEYDEARKVLGKCVKWSPTCAIPAFEYAETFRIKGEIDEFLKLTLDIFKIAFKPEHLARCFRSLGYYFAEKGMWNEGITCCLVSQNYEQSEIADNEIQFIAERTEGDVRVLEKEEFKMLCEEYGFPFGPDKEVVSMACQFGAYALADGNILVARYFWNYGYELTKNDELKSMIDKLPSIPEQ